MEACASFESWLAQSDSYRLEHMNHVVAAAAKDEAEHVYDRAEMNTPPMVPAMKYPLLSPISPSQANGSITSESGYASGVLSFDSLPSPTSLEISTNFGEQHLEPTTSWDAQHVVDVSPTLITNPAEQIQAEDPSYYGNSEEQKSEVNLSATEILQPVTPTQEVEELMATVAKEGGSSGKEVNTGLKPEESFIEIIARAIMAAPGQKMILADIYEHVPAKYPYFLTSSCAWRNSVRHNLSVNECFIKAGRAKSGRGFFWSIHPSCIEDFLRGDFNRRQARKRVQAANKRAERTAKQQEIQTRYVESDATTNNRMPAAPISTNVGTSYGNMTSTPVRHAAFHPYSRYPSNRQATPEGVSSACYYDSMYNTRYYQGHSAQSPYWYGSNTAVSTPPCPQSLITPLNNLSQLGYSPVYFNSNREAQLSWSAQHPHNLW